MNQPDTIPRPSHHQLFGMMIETVIETVASARPYALKFRPDQQLAIADQLKQLAACCQHLAAELLDEYEKAKKK
jgi:hypothetical protein